MQSRARAQQMREIVVPRTKPDSGSIEIEILVQAGDWPPRAQLKRLVRRVVDMAAASVRPRTQQGAELSLLFTDNEHIRVLNRQFRNIDQPTNVLAFPSAASTGRLSGVILGDIVVAWETLQREAQSRGLTIEAHLAHLILHGLLHILGYDHGNEAEALTMERLEAAILDDLGIADPYASQP